MSKQEKKSFLGGAAVLAAAVAIVKIIGAVYKIPLGNIIGDEGKAHFTVAYNIYNLLLTISTAGLPLAISKLTSEAHALGRENEKRKIFSTSIWLFFGLGLVFSLFMFCAAGRLHERLPGLLVHPGPVSGGLLRVSFGLHAGLYPGTGKHDPHRGEPDPGGAL